MFSLPFSPPLPCSSSTLDLILLPSLLLFLREGILLCCPSCPHLSNCSNAASVSGATGATTAPSFTIKQTPQQNCRALCTFWASGYFPNGLLIFCVHLSKPGWGGVWWPASLVYWVDFRTVRDPVSTIKTTTKKKWTVLEKRSCPLVSKHTYISHTHTRTHACMYPPTHPRTHTTAHTQG